VMYVNAMGTRFAVGMLTPAIRAKREVLLWLRFRGARTFFHNANGARLPCGYDLI
jgi:hypothetical protein